MVADVYYKYSSDFDYRSYLEEKSHTDRIVLTIDNVAQKIVGQRENIAKNIYAGQQALTCQLSSMNDNLESIDTTINKGNDQVSIELKNISSDICSLSAICDFGFESLTNIMTSSNELLGKVVDALQTPDQTKANENYELALRCTKDKFWDEALEYINIAIHGNEYFPGYKLEPKFYFLRGIIYAGITGSTISLVDLSKAIDDFISSAKYCAGNNDHLKAEAFSNAAWCLYCTGKTSEAIEYFTKSLGVSDKYITAKCMFLLSKAYMHVDSFELAKKWFIAAIIDDVTYYYRSLNDSDFTKYRKLIDEWALEAKRTLDEWNANSISNQFSVEGIKSLQELAAKENIPFKDANKIVNILKKYSSQECTLPELVTFRKTYYSLSNEIQTKINEIISALESKSLSLINKKPNEKPMQEKSYSYKTPRANMSDSATSGAELGIYIGLLIAILITLYAAIRADSIKESIGVFIILGVVFGVIGVVCGSLIGTFAIGPILFIKDMALKIGFGLKNRDEYNNKLKDYESYKKNISKENEYGEVLQKEINNIKVSLPNIPK